MDTLPGDANGQASPEPQWYLAIYNEVYGPATKAELTRWAAEGRIIPGAHVLAVGTDRWVPFHQEPSLSDIPLAAPPPPAAYAYRADFPRLSEKRLSDCPACGGPVVNVAPTYGWPWGFFQRALKPEFRCAQCQRPVAYEELASEAQVKVTRGVRTASCAWFAIVIGLIVFIAACFFAAFAAFR